MKENFETALKALLKHEGGYVNHPVDPGGMTNLGVTRRVWEEYVGHAVDEQTMRGLTPEAVAPLDRKSTRLNSSHVSESRMPSSA